MCNKCVDQLCCRAAYISCCNRLYEDKILPGSEWQSAGSPTGRAPASLGSLSATTGSNILPWRLHVSAVVRGRPAGERGPVDVDREVVCSGMTDGVGLGESPTSQEKDDNMRGDVITQRRDRRNVEGFTYGSVWLRAHGLDHPDKLGIGGIGCAIESEGVHMAVRCFIASMVPEAPGHKPRVIMLPRLCCL